MPAKGPLPETWHDFRLRLISALCSLLTKTKSGVPFPIDTWLDIPYVKSSQATAAQKRFRIRLSGDWKMAIVHDDEAGAAVCISTSDLLDGCNIDTIVRDKLADLFCSAALNDTMVRERVRSKLEQALNSPLTNQVLKDITYTTKRWVVADDIDDPGAFVIEVINPIRGSDFDGLAIPLHRRALLKPGFCIWTYVRDAIPRQIGLARSVLDHLPLPGDEWSRHPWLLAGHDKALYRWLVTQPSPSVRAITDQTNEVQYLIEQQYLDDASFDLGQWVAMEAGRRFCHRECIEGSKGDRFFQRESKYRYSIK